MSMPKRPELELAAAPTTTSETGDPAMHVRLFLIRGLAAVAWAVAFAMVADSLATETRILLVLYPMIDVVATAADAVKQHGAARRLLALNSAVSAGAAVAMVLAVTGDVGDALGVFGVWAAVTGAAQLAVAIARRRTFGWQWPMLLAGGLSTVGGISFALTAAGENPRLDPLTLYAAAGGAFFIVQAALLARRRTRHTAPNELSVPPAQLKESMP